MNLESVLEFQIGIYIHYSHVRYLDDQVGLSLSNPFKMPRSSNLGLAGVCG